METISETSVLQSILPISNNGGKKSLFIDTSSPLIANSNNSNSNMHALLTAPTDMTSLPVMSPMPMPGMSSMGGVAGMDAPEFGLTSQTIKVMDVLSQSFQIGIDARMQGGFFKHEDVWTCYRRNFIRVSCAISLLSDMSGAGPSSGSEKVLFAQVNGERLPITSFNVGLRAASNIGTGCELVMFSSRREKRAQRSVNPRPIRAGGILNQRRSSVISTPRSASSSDSGALSSGMNNLLSAPPADVVHFERVQFRSATSNNGKRKSIQQYFRIIVSIDAVLTDGRSIEVACCESADIVVRGRSPGHYADVERIKERQAAGSCSRRTSITDGILERRPSISPDIMQQFSMSGGPLTAGQTMQTLSESFLAPLQPLTYPAYPQQQQQQQQQMLNPNNGMTGNYNNTELFQPMNYDMQMAPRSSDIQMQSYRPQQPQQFQMNQQQQQYFLQQLQFFPQQQQEMNFIQPLQQQSKLLAPLNTQPLNASDGLLNFPGLSSPTGCRSSTNRDPLLLMPESPRDSDKPKLNLPQLSTNFGRLPLKSPGPMSANGGDQLVGQLFGNFSSLTWQ